MKNFKCFILICCLIFIFPLKSIAATGNNENISPNLIYLESCHTILSINDSGTAKIFCDATGEGSSITKMSIYSVLQQYNNGKWVDSTADTTEKSGTSVTFSKSYKVYSGYKYRVKATYKVYKSSTVLEAVTRYSDVVEY